MEMNRDGLAPTGVPTKNAVWSAKFRENVELKKRDEPLKTTLPTPNAVVLSIDVPDELKEIALLDLSFHVVTVDPLRVIDELEESPASNHRVRFEKVLGVTANCVTDCAIGLLAIAEVPKAVVTLTVK
jgi:hypothetical protein